MKTVMSNLEEVNYIIDTRDYMHNGRAVCISYKHTHNVRCMVASRYTIYTLRVSLCECSVQRSVWLSILGPSILLCELSTHTHTHITSQICTTCSEQTCFDSQQALYLNDAQLSTACSHSQCIMTVVTVTLTILSLVDSRDITQFDSVLFVCVNWRNRYRCRYSNMVGDAR